MHLYLVRIFISKCKWASIKRSHKSKISLQFSLIFHLPSLSMVVNIVGPIGSVPHRWLAHVAVVWEICFLIVISITPYANTLSNECSKPFRHAVYIFKHSASFEQCVRSSCWKSYISLNSASMTIPISREVFSERSRLIICVMQLMSAVLNTGQVAGVCICPMAKQKKP